MQQQFEYDARGVTHTHPASTKRSTSASFRQPISCIPWPWTMSTAGSVSFPVMSYSILLRGVVWCVRVCDGGREVWGGLIREWRELQDMIGGEKPCQQTRCRYTQWAVSKGLHKHIHLLHFQL
jgi:hypothetical protein